MIFNNPATSYSFIRQQLVKNYCLDENDYVRHLLSIIKTDPLIEKSIRDLATDLVQEVRNRHSEQQGILAFIRQYNLSTKEGVILMCLAEALLRIPDAATANKFIQDKLSQSNWQQYIGASDSLFVNASTWGLMLSGKIVQLEPEISNNIGRYLNSLISKSSEPIIRAALKEAMYIMGKQFVISESIEDAVSHDGLYSFDMLGEAAISADSSEKYFNAYLHAIRSCSGKNTISVKLSALHCRYEFSHQPTLRNELYPKLKILIETAINCNIAITIDAEESNRLDIMLDVFKFMYEIAVKHHWSGLGIAVQAYQYRGLSVLEWLNEISSLNACAISVRLVKGAYWDTEIKLAQQLGFDYYPVFTRKENTDLSYLCCVQYLFNCKHLFPQFASHNAQTIAAIIHYSQSHKNKNFEFQRLFGMGDLLYDSLLKKHDITCRIYAPVGNYKSLLPYLVRRLLENGANSSFVQRIENTEIDINTIIRSPIDSVKKNNQHCNTQIPLPKNIFSSQRENSSGINLTDINQLQELEQNTTDSYKKTYAISPVINGKEKIKSSTTRQTLSIINPADNSDIIGTIKLATISDINTAMLNAKSAFPAWSTGDISKRSDCLITLSNLIEENKFELIMLCVREAGRCLTDAISEIREAIDFCRYYAEHALSLFQAEFLTGPTGESNILKFKARGIYLCISPWNFPIAIFTGQITAALVTGNCVLAKPAQQTSLCASRIIDLCFKAGIPKDVLQFIPSSSSEISDTCLKHPDLSGVVFTGSLTSANKIKQTLSLRAGAIIPLIAETSGMNAMIVDSSALPEQLVLDVLYSAFNSAGQRCSSLRFLYLQDEIADTIIDLLKAAMTELTIAEPQFLSTDIGPLIDKKSKDKIEQHIKFLNGSDFAIKIVGIDSNEITAKSNKNFFIQPSLYEITHLSQITEEIFGPVLHIIRYRQSNLANIIGEINQSGFGLTLGIHSRISSTIETVIKLAKIGNIYVNRNIIGAVVGVQPFGGQGCSGTGPKAGGPHYLKNFCTEQLISTNITAIGGNSVLLNLNSD